MSWHSYIIGFLSFPIVMMLFSAGWIEGKRFLKLHRKQPAGVIISILHGQVFDQRKRMSARPLIATRGKHRSYALVLFKQGPNEPVTAGSPFTEPLDDESSAPEEGESSSGDRLTGKTPAFGAGDAGSNPAPRSASKERS